MLSKKQLTIIAGPCAAESPQQLNQVAKNLVKTGFVQAVRASLFKPRTNHPLDSEFFDGIGSQGISWFIDIAIKHNIPLATEVLIPEHVIAILKELNLRPSPPKLILWLGSRNQNHLIQTEIARVIKNHAPKETLLLIKNQPWRDQKHWEGILSHVLASGLSKNRIILCHRGFQPDGRENPHQLRNLPDFSMAMAIKKITGLPMLLDPSHIGGSVANVIQIVKDARSFDFDGLMIEVHNQPKKALSDAKQQLSILQFKKLLSSL